MTISPAAGSRRMARSDSTAMGRVRTVLLADGSQATLSSDSRIEVALSRSERRIDLRQGEAYFVWT